MVPRCFHTLDNGQRCSAPAIMGSKFCRLHDLERSPKPARQESREPDPLNLPLIVDKPSSLAAVNEVLQAMSERRIKRSEAQTLLSGIRFAARLAVEIAEEGLTQLPALPARHIQPMRNDRPQSARTDDKLALALAAAADQRKPTPFSTPRPSSAFQSEVDPETARIVKELVAQSHEVARTQIRREQRP